MTITACRGCQQDTPLLRLAASSSSSVTSPRPRWNLTRWRKGVKDNWLPSYEVIWLKLKLNQNISWLTVNKKLLHLSQTSRHKVEVEGWNSERIRCKIINFYRMNWRKWMKVEIGTMMNKTRSDVSAASFLLLFPQTKGCKQTTNELKVSHQEPRAGRRAASSSVAPSLSVSSFQPPNTSVLQFVWHHFLSAHHFLYRG